MKGPENEGGGGALGVRCPLSGGGEGESFLTLSPHFSVHPGLSSPSSQTSPSSPSLRSMSQDLLFPPLTTLALAPGLPIKGIRLEPTPLLAFSASGGFFFAACLSLDRARFSTSSPSLCVNQSGTGSSNSLLPPERRLLLAVSPSCSAPRVKLPTSTCSPCAILVRNSEMLYCSFCPLPYGSFGPPPYDNSFLSPR